MAELRDFSAVIFDLDGLVLDTESTYQHAWQQAAALMGYRLDYDFCSTLTGLAGTEIERMLQTTCGTEFDLLAFKRLSSQCWRDFVQAHGIAVKQGFTELLACLVQQQIPYCLATNSRLLNAQECLRLAGLADVFSLMVTRDDVQKPKPDPEIFLMAADLLQVPVCQCLVFEDSPAGVLAARRAGARVMMIPSVEIVAPDIFALCDGVALDMHEAVTFLQRDRFAPEIAEP